MRNAVVAFESVSLVIVKIVVADDDANAIRGRFGDGDWKSSGEGGCSRATLTPLVRDKGWLLVPGKCQPLDELIQELSALFDGRHRLCFAFRFGDVIARIWFVLCFA